MKNVKAGVVALAVAAMLAGCGGGSGSDTPAPGGSPTPAPAGDAGGEAPPDPCELLTQDEIEDVAGAEVTGTDGPVEEFMGSRCSWTLAAEAMAGEVTLTAWVGLDFYSPEADDAGLTSFEPVSGIGDAAHRWPPGQGLCTVIFRTGELVVQVLSAGAGDDGCIDLAQSAAGRV